jgi:hypothetical protein
LGIYCPPEAGLRARNPSNNNKQAIKGGVFADLTAADSGLSLDTHGLKHVSEILFNKKHKTIGFGSISIEFGWDGVQN